MVPDLTRIKLDPKVVGGKPYEILANALIWKETTF
jgi:hypothetical protein